MLGFEAQQRRILWPMRFDSMCLNIISCSFIIMQQKLKQIIAPIWALHLIHLPQMNNHRYVIVVKLVMRL